MLAVVTCAFLLAVSGCRTPEASDAIEPTSKTVAPTPIANVAATSPPPTPPSIAPPPTIALPDNTPDSATALASAMNLPARYFASAYDLQEVEGSHQFCVNVDAPDVAHPPAGSSKRQALGRHAVSTSTYVYADYTTAIEMVEYARTMFDRCHGAYVIDATDQHLLSYHRVVESSDRPTNVDELVSVDSSFASATETRFVYTDVGRTGPVVFIASTTDPVLLPELSQRITDRVSGLVGEGSILVPRGVPDIGPGLTDAIYWAWDDGPPALRAARFESTEATAFVDVADDVRLDQLAGSACAAMWNIEPSTDMSNLLIGLFSESELDEYGGDISEVAATALAIYCPGFHEAYVVASGS